MSNSRVIVFSVVLLFSRGTAYSQTPPKDTIYHHDLASLKFFHPRTEAITATVEKQILHPGQKHNSYNGAIVVLVNASAISQAEHTCLALFQSRQGKNIRFVGEATAGANGGVKYAILANNVRIRFSSEDIRHADGRQLQRIGIQPHVFAAPTIAGIRAGRDEVLEKGVEVLRAMINKEK